MKLIPILSAITLASAAPLDTTSDTSSLFPRQEVIYTTIRPTDGQCRFVTQIWRRENIASHNAQISVSERKLVNDLKKDSTDLSPARWTNDERGIFLVPIAENTATVRHVGVYGSTMEIKWVKDPFEGSTNYDSGTFNNWGKTHWLDHLEFKWTGRDGKKVAFADNWAECVKPKWEFQGESSVGGMVVKTVDCKFKC